MLSCGPSHSYLTPLWAGAARCFLIGQPSLNDNPQYRLRDRTIFIYVHKTRRVPTAVRRALGNSKHSFSNINELQHSVNMHCSQARSSMFVSCQNSKSISCVWPAAHTQGVKTVLERSGSRTAQTYLVLHKTTSNILQIVVYNEGICTILQNF